MKKQVAIIDYGLGNIVSAQQSFIKDAKENNLNVDVVITNDVRTINDSTHIVLPGQGAFNSCIEGLRSIDGMIDSLENNVLNKKKPFLGICVGMQLLAEEGRENGTLEKASRRSYGTPKEKERRGEKRVAHRRTLKFPSKLNIGKGMKTFLVRCLAS